MIDLQSIANDWAHGQALAIRLSQAPAKPTCECDYDGQGDPLEYVKTSHYCPVHDECESCGECMGVMKDPDFPKGYDLAISKRAAWLCQKCSELCADCGNHPSEGHSQRCIERAAERERCGYCGQDHCDCKTRYGVVQGIVSARAKGGR